MRILFCSEHCLADAASGAAISAVEMLTLLRDRGWDIAALCGTKMDGPSPPPVGDIVKRLPADDDLLAVHHLDWRGIPVRVARSADRAGDPDARLAALPVLLDLEIRRQRPDLVLSYGGGWLSRALLKTARRAGVPSVFWLRNTFYERRDLFADTTGVIVPSSFTARHYQRTLGLSSEVLFSVVLHDRVHCPVRQPKYLTFVSPMPEKGVFFFARLASELGRLRPDIEILIVEGRGNREWLARTGLDVLAQPNVRVMGRTDDPRQFLAVTRVLCFPSVWAETFGRTAVEAMVSGVPVLASDRGGLPEVVGTGGVVLPIPDRLQQDTPVLASPSEVRPWLDAIYRLWDDEDQYRALTRNAISSAARFDPDVIADRAHTLLTQWATTPVNKLPLGDDALLTTSGYPTDPRPALATWKALTPHAEHLLG